MTGREASIFTSLIEAAVAPASPLPPVAGTDAVPAFSRYLTAIPRPNSWGLRAALLALDEGPRLLRYGAPLRRLADGEGSAYIARLQGSRLKPLIEALRGLAQMFYYGDQRVMCLLGYDSTERVARGRALREAEGRW